MKHHLHHSICLLLASFDNFLSEMNQVFKCAAVMQCEIQGRGRMWLQRIDGVSEQWEAARQRHLRQRFICAAACLGIEMEVKFNCFLAALIPLFSFGCLVVGGQQKKTKKRGIETDRERERK